MKIAYLGDGPWAHLALERILSRPDWRVVLIGVRHESPDPVLRDKAQHLGIPFLTPKRINDREPMDALKQSAADLIVSMSYDQIIRKPLIELPAMGFINVHAGALPFYRGRNILNWVLINGETSFGVTCHFVDEGIDTGDIIVQKHFAIAADDDYGSVLIKAQHACADVLYEALEKFSDGTVVATPQREIHPVGFYCGRRGPGDEVLDWSLSAQRIHNFVRGVALPGPAARIWLGSEEFAVIKSSLVSDACLYIGTVGEVVGRDESGVLVKCVDSVLRFCLVSPVSGGQSAPPHIPRWKVGTRFNVAVPQLLSHREQD